jgi:hypothetical protein
MKKKVIFLVTNIVLFLAIFIFYGEALAQEKIVQGVSKEEALERFGSPSKVNENYWYYQGDNPFYVQFSRTPQVGGLFLFPYSYDVTVGEPFEVKAFLSYSDFHTEEVTPQVKWEVSDARIVEKNRYFIPYNPGKAYIFAEYKGIESNVCKVNIKPKEKSKEEEVNYRPIVLPDKPVVTQFDRLTFAALRGFSEKSTFFIRDISLDKKTNWYSYDQQKGEQLLEDNQIKFPDLGEIEVYCKYEGIKSVVQTVKVNERVDFRSGIKSISILPSFAILGVDQVVHLRGFATHYNNRIEDITRDLSWRVSDESIANFKSRQTWPEKAQLILKKEGLIEIEAELSPGLKSSTQLRVVVAEEGGSQQEEVKDQDREKPEDTKTMAEEIKDEAENLASDQVELISVKAFPNEIVVSLGEKKKVEAEAYYSNQYKRDVSGLVTWVSSEPEVALVKNKEVIPQAQGSTEIRALFQEVKSNAIFIRVNPPKLTSIALDKYNLKKSVNKNFKVKATGHYADESIKDITDSVQWDISNSEIIKEKGKGSFVTLKEGQVTLSCQHKGIESLPLKIDVFVPFWIKVLNVLLYLLGFFTAVLMIFYFMIKAKVAKLKKAKASNPRKFIDLLYDNFRKVVSVFGVDYDYSNPPLVHARLINKKFKTKNNCFTDIGMKFSKAVYSSEEVSLEEAEIFEKRYNEGLSIIKNSLKHPFGKIVKLFFLRYPFTI